LKWKSQKKTIVGKVIEAKTTNVKKSLISQVLHISKRNLYYQNTKRLEKDVYLREQIYRVLEVNPAYGHRRIALALNLGKKRVRRAMKLFGIKPYKRKARWSKRRDFGKKDAGYPNLIRGFCPIKPNIVYAGDFTRLIWNQKIIYLATYIDLFTREIVGWSVSTKHTNDLVIEAYLDAVRNTGKSLIVHTDQGSEYKSKEYAELMTKLDVKISMSKKRQPLGKRISGILVRQL